MLNTIYLLVTKPYFDPDNATLDYINCFFLMAIAVLTATYSAWNTNTYERFVYGILFDAIVVLQFFVNMAYILGQVKTSLILKAKQFRFRCKERKRLDSIRRQKARKAAEY